MLFDTKQLKLRAKQTIEGRVFSIFLVLFVAFLVMNCLNYLYSAYSLIWELPKMIELFRSLSDGYLPGLDDYGTDLIRQSLVAQWGSRLIGIWSLLVIPLGVALIHYTMKIARKEKDAVGHSVGSLFRDGVQNYGAYFGTAFVTGLLISLWSLLLIIPGIIKAYEYTFVNYLKADDPKLTGEQCRNLSSRMTEGYKWDIFVLHLSFIGWWLLSALTFGLVGIYVYPYYYTTMALLYDDMKENALKTGRIHPQELGRNPADYGQAPISWAQGGRPYPYGPAAQAQPVYPYGYPVQPPMQVYRNTPQMLKQMVAAAHPGAPLSRSGVPLLHWQEAVSLIEECRKNGFLILSVDAYRPDGRYALELSLSAPLGNTWDAARQLILQNAQSFQLSYEIVF